MRKKILIMMLALAALLGLSTLYATASSDENTVTLHVGTGQPFDTLDAALNYVSKTRSADLVEIILQSDTTMNITARSLPQDVTIKSDEGGPYTVTNTADYVVDGGQNLTLENVTFASSEGTAFQVNNGTMVTSGAVTLAGNRIIVNSGNSATIDDGTTITGNNLINNSGGGVYVYSGGTFTMNGGTITGNSVTGSYPNGYGGGVFLTGGTFIMNGGTITDNTATYGGGVYPDMYSTATMSGGTISNNTATQSGGGVYNVVSTFTMNGGIITGNKAGANGGGVHVYMGDVSYQGTTFTMNGGTITGNTANGNGGGIYMQNGNLNLSGTPVVRDNTQTNGTASNFYNTNAYVNVTDSLRDGAEVWVTNPAMENSEFGKGTTDTVAAASARYFRNDLYSLTGSANGTSLTWARIVAELLDNNTVHGRFASLAEAIAVYTDPDTQMILLADNITTASMVDKTIYLDLNGKTITGDLTVNDGCTLYGLDSTSDDYKGTGTGRISGTITGIVAPYTDTKAAHTTKGKHYLKVTEDDGISFHRYNVQVKDYYFRLVFDENDPADTGNAMINFSSAVQGDSKVADAITRLELSSSANEVAEEKTSAAPSDLEALKNALTAGSTYTYRSHFIFISNPYTAEYALKTTLSLNLSDGKTATLTSTRNRTLKDILGYFYKASGTTQEQKNAIDAFLTKYGLGTIPT